MNGFLARLSLILVTFFQFSSFVSAGPLDDYYLRQFGETQNIQLQKAILSVSVDAQESARCGMPLKHGLSRDWNLLEQATQKVLAKQLAQPVLLQERTYTSPAGHFLIHYATTGRNAPSLADLDTNGVPDWIETVASTFETVYTYYSSQGYRPAPTRATGVPYDIYLRDLAPEGFYGVTESNQPVSSAGFPNAYSSWIELDNNFTDSIYKPAIYTPLQSLQITAAHEYHHAIQYGYSYFFDVWYAEATSTWMEDEVYDTVDQSYSYIPNWFSNSTKALDLDVGPDATTTGAGYARWIFNRFLAEKHSPAMIRGVWEKVAGLPSPDSFSDTPMLPVLESVLSSATYGTSLSSDFFAFAKRVYTRDWTTHLSETNKIHTYFPVATYSVYPVNSSVSNPISSVTLPHYSFAYYTFTPASGSNSLTISINKTSGIETALFKTAEGVVTEITGNSGGTSYSVGSFGAAKEVALLIANTTNLDDHTANFSTDGTLVAVSEPVPQTPATSTVSGNKSGCFIATAAYGSYLHPHVQLLRNFRDEYLLTTAPGRAFVAFYYHWSPPLADFIARHAMVRSATRLALTPLIVAVAYPLISFVSLFLLFGTVLVSRVRRIKTARANTQQQRIEVTYHARNWRDHDRSFQ
jgi:hypothetical protein